MGVGVHPLSLYLPSRSGVRSSVRGQITYAPPISTLPQYVLCEGFLQEAEGEDLLLFPRNVTSKKRFADLFHLYSVVYEINSDNDIASMANENNRVLENKYS